MARRGPGALLQPDACGCLRRRNDCRISLASTAKIRPRRCYNCRGLCDIVCTVLPDVRRHRLECCREAAGDLGICLGTTHCRLRRTDALVIGSLPISVCGRTAWRAGRFDLVGQSADNRRSRTVLSDNFLRARADRLLFLSPSAQLRAKSLVLPGAVRRRIVWVRFLRLVIVVEILVVFPFAGWRQLHRPHTNIDTVAQKLRQEAKPNDLIVVNPWSFGVSFNWYYHGKTPWVTVPEIAEHRSHRHDMYKAKMMEPFPLDDLEEAIRATLRLGNRVWLAGNVDILPPGKSPLSPLAAPDPEFGWRQSVYRTAWSQQLGRFLREHVSQLSVVLRPTLNVHGEENLLILVAEGWHD